MTQVLTCFPHKYKHVFLTNTRLIALTNLIHLVDTPRHQQKLIFPLTERTLPTLHHLLVYITFHLIVHLIVTPIANFSPWTISNVQSLNQQLWHYRFAQWNDYLRNFYPAFPLVWCMLLFFCPVHFCQLMFLLKAWRYLFLTLIFL